MAEETKNTTEAQAVSESRTEIIHMVRPNHLNGAGRLFGGALMQWLDEAAGTVAMRHAHCNVITASVDNLRFIRGAYNGEIIVIIGKVTYVGRTSMVLIRMWSILRTECASPSTGLTLPWSPWMKTTSREPCPA